ncbi:MAG: class I SAM-dependent methyltransferase [Bacteroidales bacterium]
MNQNRKKQWYQLLFDNYGQKYDQEPFTAGTLGECDFIEQELGYNKSLSLLDVGCGTGRHAIELTRRGYNVTGIDLSESQLQQARKKALDNGLDIPFICMDARSIHLDQSFDVALMLCEGGFPLMETDEMNFQILESVSRTLKPACRFIFTTLNGLFPLFHSINDFHAIDSVPQGAAYVSQTFDLMTFRDHNTTTFTDDNGVEHQLNCNERYYLPCEITWLLKTLGFSTIDILGARLGAFSRNDKLATNDFEMLVIAQRNQNAKQKHTL